MRRLPCEPHWPSGGPSIGRCGVSVLSPHPPDLFTFSPSSIAPFLADGESEAFGKATFRVPAILSQDHGIEATVILPLLLFNYLTRWSPTHVRFGVRNG